MKYPLEIPDFRINPTMQSTTSSECNELKPIVKFNHKWILPHKAEYVYCCHKVNISLLLVYWSGVRWAVVLWTMLIVFGWTIQMAKENQRISDILVELTKQYKV